MKVVIDTNILINAAGDESSHAFRIVREVIEERLLAYANHQTMSENRQILRKLVKDRVYREMLEEYFRKLKVVKSSSLKSLPSGGGGMGGGREDLKLFQSAIAARADYLITEDREVLEVEKYQGTEVITPRDFWIKYQGETGNDSVWEDWTKIILGK